MIACERVCNECVNYMFVWNECVNMGVECVFHC